MQHKLAARVIGIWVVALLLIVPSVVNLVWFAFKGDVTKVIGGLLGVAMGAFVAGRARKEQALTRS